ncbi:FliH/SctL family protein [Bacillus horti]|uniref:Flagellar assembly protein FliH n=1 Tax=Caldalkalibacillus horti TaxID=77523 RepID=A0ABT9VUJ5_9BACI|nr:FliH/SctL family protein [Bacillus horti]MDQ0164662.1 flagellar assembly protein FliH [Bacillus horti]
MSNVYKSRVVSSIGQKMLSHQKIHNKQQEDKLIGLNVEQIKSEIEIVTEQKKVLELEVEGLLAQLRELDEKINTDKRTAQDEIEQLWQTTKQEIEQLSEETLKSAQEQGFEQGYQAGYKQVQEELEHKKVELRSIVEKAYEHKDRIIQDSEPFLLELSVKMAKKILQHELETSEKQIIEMIQHSLKLVKERGDIVIEVNPTDYPILLTHLDELEEYLDDSQELKVIPADVSQVSQGCFIHTERGTYDVTIDNQLQELKNQLLALFEESVCE